MSELQTSLTDRERRRGWLVVAAFCAMVVYLIVSHAFPGAAVIGCPFRWLTDFSCFGCGMTRSASHFLHGDLSSSVHYHPFGGAFVIAFAVSAAHHAAQNLRGEHLDYRMLRWWRRVEKPVLVVSAVSVGIFGVVRFALEVTGFLTPI